LAASAAAARGSVWRFTSAPAGAASVAAGTSAPKHSAAATPATANHRERFMVDAAQMQTAQADDGGHTPTQKNDQTAACH